MITSAGCNALDYLLDNPEKIYCIDVNNKQNSLLELKLSLFKHSDFETLFSFFGKGKHTGAKEIYDNQLRFSLSKEAKEFWDKKISYFNGKGWRNTFYYRGTSGLLAYSTMAYFKMRRRLYKQVKNLMAATTLPQQVAQYAQLEPRLANPFIDWVMNRHLVMCMAGVPQSQQALFVEKYDNGVMGFIEECFQQIFTKIPVQDNYFWKVYMNGSYTADCCPEYLKASNYQKIKEHSDRIKIRTTSISRFLENKPGKYTHYVLLDHQDWLAENDVEELEKEWRLILKNSKKGTKILLRSAAHQINFFPDFVKKAVHFQKEEILDIHQQDRVGTYASVYLGTVQ
jgi:S-adenosylmethionine-diacylglycerol 3-amino-3-carboxypropyl transferase